MTNATVTPPATPDSTSTTSAFRPRPRRRRQGLAWAVEVVAIVVMVGLTSSATAQTTPAPPAPSDAAEAPATAATPVGPPAPLAPALVGDSLAVGATPFLPTAWRIDAKYGRALHEQESLALLAAVPPAVRCVVVALGTNDVHHRLSQDQMVAEVERVDQLLAGHACVRWTTVKVAGVTPFYNPAWPSYAAQWNRVIDKHAAGEVLDWNAIAEAHPEYFLGDGLHMEQRGQAAYAAFLRDGVRPAGGQAA